jgi:hypothetical protein
MTVVSAQSAAGSILPLCSSQLVLYYRDPIKTSESSQGEGFRETHSAKVIKVNQKLLKF